jgi:MFS family permease
MRTRAYWLLAFSTTLPPMIGTAMLFDIQPLLATRHIGADTAAFAVSAWSATMAIMAIPSGRLVDRFPPGPIVSAGMAAIIASCITLWLAASPLAAIAALSLYAVGQSLVASAIGTTAARFFGRQHHGVIRSSLSRIGVIATGLGPLLFGLSLRFTGDYDTALIGFAVACLPALVGAHWLAQPAAATVG